MIQTLNLHGKAFIMPAIKGPGIKKAIMEHVKEKRPAVSKYTMTSWEGYTATFTLVILEKTPEPDEVKKETDRYIVFATNARARSKQDLISKIPDEYKKRWGIETGYACMERIRPRTSSRNDSIRMLLMYLPLVIYNAWIMENYAAGACADGGRPRHHTQAPHVSLYPDHSGVSTFLAVFSLLGICRVVHFQLLLSSAVPHPHCQRCPKQRPNRADQSGLPNL